MGAIFEPINQLLGIILQAIYNLINNFGVSIIIFTVIIRIIILPLTLKQQRSAFEMQRIKPYIDEINKKYKNDKEKLQQEMLKLYQEHGVNPMAGCLPLLIQFPILISLYQVIIRPLTYILKMSGDQIYNIQKELAANTSILTNVLHFNQQQVANFVNQVNSKSYVYNGEIIAAKAKDLIHFDLLGIDLSAIPRFDMSNLLGSIDVLWIIPLLAALTTYLSSKYMMMTSNTDGNEQAQQMNNTMSIMMPLMTLWFSFSVPLGVGLYWLINNIIQMAMQFALNTYFLPKMKEGVESGNDKKSRKNRKNS